MKKTTKEKRIELVNLRISRKEKLLENILNDNFKKFGYTEEQWEKEKKDFELSIREDLKDLYRLLERVKNGEKLKYHIDNVIIV